MGSTGNPRSCLRRAMMNDVIGQARKLVRRRAEEYWDTPFHDIFGGGAA
jgi:hypothetical protein